jgi:tRNA modification GTPase
MYATDTIAAISTALGEGGIGIVRISGAEALDIMKRIFRPLKNGGFHSHRFYYGVIADPSTDITLDEVMAVYMRSPNSFTREDVVEIHCHGGTLVVQRLLGLVLASGARLAEPGEFTRRAFLNGRIDLLQAEAIIDIIRAKTDAASALAQHQREGLLSVRLFSIRDMLRQSLALVEAFIDFPEEALGPENMYLLSANVTSALALVRELVAGYSEGRVLREGVSVVIAGKPNVGKSSMLNMLLAEKRAIVSSIPGTTRDLIEEVVNINGLPVRLLDTAGLRESSDPIELEGVSRAVDRIIRADLVIFLLDRSRPFDSDDRLVAEALTHSRFILVTNKADLPAQLYLPDELSLLPVIEVSTTTGYGMDKLKHELTTCFLHGRVPDSREFVALSRARHVDAMSRAERCIGNFLAGLDQSLDSDLLAIELRDALGAIVEVTGETTPDDILDIVFNQFCIGK